MSKGIILSKKHGVNASVLCCPVCGKDYGIVLLGRLKNDAEAPRRVYGDLCEDCAKFAKEHVFVLEAKELKPLIKTGRYLIVKKEEVDTDSTINFMIEEEFEKLLKRYEDAVSETES